MVHFVLDLTIPLSPLAARRQAVARRTCEVPLSTLRCAVLSSLLSVCAGTLVGQSVLIVGPGGFATIQAAVDAAVDGDVVRIAPGIYNNFICTKGLTLLCDPPGTVRITRLTSAPSGTSFSMTPLVTPAQQLRLCDLVFDQYPVFGFSSVGISGGVSSIERCTFVGSQNPMLTVAAYATAVMRHCTLQGVGAPLFVTSSSHVTASQCTFTSGPAIGISSFNAAVIVQGSTAQFSNCTMTGGSLPPVISGVGGGPGIQASASTVWVVDCVIRGGNSVTAGILGGPAIVSSLGTVYHDRCTLIGGTSPSGPVPVIFGAAQAQPMLAATSSGFGLQPASKLRVVFTAAPRDPLFVLATTEVQPAAVVPFTQQPSFGFQAPVGIIVAAVFTDERGSASVTIPVPNTPSVLHTGLWVRGIDAVSVPLQASPVVGGVIRNGG